MNNIIFFLTLHIILNTILLFAVNCVHPWQECSRAGNLRLHWLCPSTEDRRRWSLFYWQKEILA